MDIIRAWKDAEYCNSLSEAERAALPPHPAGLIALTDEDLGAVAGGRLPSTRSVEDGGECARPLSEGGGCFSIYYCGSY